MVLDRLARTRRAFYSHGTTKFCAAIHRLEHVTMMRNDWTGLTDCMSPPLQRNATWQLSEWNVERQGVDKGRQGSCTRSHLSVTDRARVCCTGRQCL